MCVRFMLPLLGFLVLALPAHGAEYLQTGRPDVLNACAPENLLCLHLRTIFGATISSTRSDGIPIWRAPIRYITAGLTPDGDALFDDLLESFVARTKLQVERVQLDRAGEAVLTFVVASDIAQAYQAKRAGSVIGRAMSEDERARTAADLKSGFQLHRTDYDPRQQRMVLSSCYAAVHPDSMKVRPALRMAAAIFSCLVGGNKSEFLKPSLLNVSEPVELDAPPYAKMTTLDRMLLETMYAADSPLNSTMPAVRAVERLETRLRAQGIGDDGRKR